MSTVQFPLYVGETYTASLHQIDGTVVEADVGATEVVPGAFNVTFATAPDGFYRIVVSDVDGALFTDTVSINSGNAINIVTSEAEAAGTATVSTAIAGFNQNLGDLQQEVQQQFATLPGDVAEVILINPANKLATNTTGLVTTSNPSTSTAGSLHTPAQVVDALLQELIGAATFPDGSLGKAIQDTFKNGDNIKVTVGAVSRTGLHEKV